MSRVLQLNWFTLLDVFNGDIQGLNSSSFIVTIYIKEYKYYKTATLRKKICRYDFYVQ